MNIVNLRQVLPNTNGINIDNEEGASNALLKLDGLAHSKHISHRTMASYDIQASLIRYPRYLIFTKWQHVGNIE